MSRKLFTSLIFVLVGVVVSVLIIGKISHEDKLYMSGKDLTKGFDKPWLNKETIEDGGNVSISIAKDDQIDLNEYFIMPLKDDQFYKITSSDTKIVISSGCFLEAVNPGKATISILEKGKKSVLAEFFVTVSNSDHDQIAATFTPESKNAFQYNSPTLRGDNIYIGTSTKIALDKDPQNVLESLPENYFYKLDLDFNVIWKYDLHKTQVGGGASLDSRGNIYFVTLDYSIDNSNESRNKGGEEKVFTLINLVSLTNDGTFRWQKKISYDGEKWTHGMINCAISSKDIIYVGDSKLYAFDMDGNIKWQYPNSDMIIKGFRSSPIIDQRGNVYFVSPDATDIYNRPDTILLYKFTSTSDGKPIYSTILGNNPVEPEGGSQNKEVMKNDHQVSSPAFSTKEKSIYAVVGNTINKIDAESGQIVWSLKPEGATGGFKASPVVDDQDTLYIGTKSNTDSNLYAITSEGKMLWKRKIGADMYPTPLIGDDHMLYVGSETTLEGHLRAINMLDGTTKWAFGRTTIGDFSFNSPILYKGFLYIGMSEVRLESNALYKIKVTANDYLPDAAWPKLQGR